MFKEVKNLVNKCEICKKCKYSNIPKIPLTVTATAHYSFEKLFLDLYGPMPVTFNGNVYLLTVQCELSKFVKAIEIPDKKAETVAKALVEEIFLRYGMSKPL